MDSKHSNSLKTGVSRTYRIIADKVSGHTVKLVLAAAVVSLAVHMPKYVAALVLVALTVAVSVLVTRAELNRLGIETATLSTVLMGAAFGPDTGALLGLLVILAQLFTGNPPGMYVLWVVPGYVLAGYLSGTLTGYEVATLGVMLNIGLQSAFLFFTAVLSRDKLPKYFQYAVFNVGFNFVLFSALAPTILQLLPA